VNHNKHLHSSQNIVTAQNFVIDCILGQK